MKILVTVLFGLVLFIATAYGTVSESGVECRSNEQLTPEALVQQAEAKFAEYLAAYNGDRAAATEKTAAYLRELKGVKEVTVRGSDSLFMIMGDGNELLLLLGRHRL